jgi:hypothetical protein
MESGYLGSEKEKAFKLVPARDHQTLLAQFLELISD